MFGHVTPCWNQRSRRHVLFFQVLASSRRTLPVWPQILLFRLFRHSVVTFWNPLSTQKTKSWKVPISSIRCRGACGILFRTNFQRFNMSLVDGLIFLTQDTTVQTMVGILTAMIVGTYGFGKLACTPTENKAQHRWLPDAETQSYKRKWEKWSLLYGVFWMSVRTSQRPVLICYLRKNQYYIGCCRSWELSSLLSFTLPSQSGTTWYVIFYWRRSLNWRLLTLHFLICGW